MARIKGITLIEVMISISLLAVGLLGLLQAFPGGIATERNLEQSIIAAQLAQAKIETYSSLAYDALATGLIEDQIPAESDISDPLYAYKRTSRVDFLDENFNPSGSDLGFKKITVTISWPSIFGVNKSLTLVSLSVKR